MLSLLYISHQAENLQACRTSSQTNRETCHFSLLKKSCCLGTLSIWGKENDTPPPTHTHIGPFSAQRTGILFSSGRWELDPWTWIFPSPFVFSPKAWIWDPSHFQGQIQTLIPCYVSELSTVPNQQPGPPSYSLLFLLLLIDLIFSYQRGGWGWQMAWIRSQHISDVGSLIPGNLGH